MTSPVATSPGSRPRWSASALVGLVVGFAWPLVLAIPGVSTRRITDVHADLVNITVKWVVVAVLGVIAFAVQKRPPRDLGLRLPGWRDVLAALAGVLAALVLGGAASYMVRMPSALTDLRALAAIPLGVRAALVLTAAIAEEFVYRGFAIEQLASLTGHRGLAAAISWALFAVSHVGIYGLTPALVVPALVGAVLTVLYLGRRNLSACVLMHTIVDGLFLIVAPSLAVPR